MTVYVLIELIYDDPESVTARVFSSMEAARIAQTKVTSLQILGLRGQDIDAEVALAKMEKKPWRAQT